MDSTDRFQTFEDLEVYRSAREFRRGMYMLARTLPDIEKFGLASQIRRAAVSLTNNIAEGHGRFHYLDQIKFMLQARGSLQELVDDVNICSDEQYVSGTDASKLKMQATKVSKLLGGYIRHLRTCKSGQNLLAREDSVDYSSSLNVSALSDVTMQPFNSSLYP